MIPTLQLGQAGLRRSSSSGGIPYATWNTAATGSGISFTNGDRTASKPGSPGSWARSTTALTGKQYFEATATPASNGVGVGVCNASISNAAPYLGQSADGLGYYLPSADAYRSAAVVFNGATDSTSPATHGIATDASAGDLKVWIRRADGGGWEGGGDPTTGASPTYTLPVGTYYPACTPGNGVNAVTINAGQAAFVLWALSGGFTGIPA